MEIHPFSVPVYCPYCDIQGVTPPEEAKHGSSRLLGYWRGIGCNGDKVEFMFRPQRSISTVRYLIQVDDMLHIKYPILYHKTTPHTQVSYPFNLQSHCIYALQPCEQPDHSTNTQRFGVEILHALRLAWLTRPLPPFHLLTGTKNMEMHQWIGRNRNSQ